MTKEQAEQKEIELIAEYKSNGVEAYTWKGKQTTAAVNACKEINKLGYKNRGVKDGSHLYVIKNTTMQAVLIELFFLDNVTDQELFVFNGAKAFASAITRSLT